MSISKTVTIKIPLQADLIKLKSNKSKLCVAKNVNDSYNVVWQAYYNYLSSSEIGWQPEYQLFCTNMFTVGEQVNDGSLTNSVQITLAQSAKLDENYYLEPTVTYRGSSTAFALVNEYGSARPAVSQTVFGLDGMPVTTPAYVGDVSIKTADAVVLTPKDRVVVWFEPNMETGTMIENPMMNTNLSAVEIDVSDPKTSAIYTYQEGAWTKG